MICTNCGTNCPEGSKFCMECGAALPIPEAPVPEETVILPAPAEEIPAAALPADTTNNAPEQSVSELQEDSEPEPVPEDIPLEQEEIPAEVPVSPAPESFLVYQTSPCQAQPQAAPPIPQAPAKKGTHWIPIVIMAVLCVFGLTLFVLLPFNNASQPSAGGSETPWFYNDNGTLYFYGDFYNGPEELTIPEIVDGQPVTTLSPYCFAGCDFTTVILPDTLERIGNNAFDGCTSMRGIFLPEGLTSIGAEAFYCCSELEAICIPSTVKSIVSGAFDGCYGLNYILYNGNHSHWLDLYRDMIGTKTQVYCTDGTFIHRHVFP